MKLRDKFAYALAIPTSMGIRITPADRQPVHASDTFLMQVTSAESNVGSVSAYLGLPVKILTAFVKDSPISAMIKQNLLSRRMSFEGREYPQDGPWGARHQFNIADAGFGCRGPRVWNDRAGEVGRMLKLEDFDIERLFDRDGVRMIHLSGLIAALSPDTGAFCLELARKARRHDTRVCFDLNHRASFWKGRESELSEIFAKIAATADVLVGNEEDYQLALGIRGPEAGGRDIAGKIDSFKEMIGRVGEMYPNVSVFANTLREVESANTHRWGALMYAEGNWHVIKPREIAVLDRIGGGDGFVGGLLYGILRGWEPEKWIRFAWASGALATTFLTDYAQPIDEKMVWDIWEGNARVQR